MVGSSYHSQSSTCPPFSQIDRRPGMQTTLRPFVGFLCGTGRSPPRGHDTSRSDSTHGRNRVLRGRQARPVAVSATGCLLPDTGIAVVPETTLSSLGSIVRYSPRAFEEDQAAVGIQPTAVITHSHSDPRRHGASIPRT